MPPARIKVLAIDPGTREMGIAHFEDNELCDYGVKTVRRNASARQTLLRLEEIVDRLIREKRPDVVVVEKNNFSQIRQNVLLTLAVHKIKAVVKRRRIKYAEYNPRTVRKLICGDGNATKRQLVKVLCSRYLELRPYAASNRQWRERYYQNLFDAVACGLAHLKLTQRDVESGRV